MRSAYRRAAAVVTVSAETLRVLAASAGLDPAKATVVHEGCDSIFLPPPGGEVRREPRLLAVGTLAPYKNHERAIDLFARLVPARPELTLELVGSDWRGYGDVVARHAAQSGVGARIRFSHDLASREVAERYQSSTLLLHLSSCESFGLPVVEAMRYGLPVVAAARSSLPEVAGGAALLVDPDDPAAAAAAVEGLLADEALLGALAAKGRAHAGELTWKRAAEGVAAVVQRVVSPGGRSSTPA
jgi:alpha-1,3-rhamnosyl/mannosyltransferase